MIETLRALRSQSTWRLFFLGLITYAVYWAFYIRTQTRILNESLAPDRRISRGLVDTVVGLNLLSLALFVPYVFVEAGHPVELLSSLADAAANISFIFWGFAARSRMNELLNAQLGTAQWFHGFWTFLFSPLYFNFKLNVLLEPAAASYLEDDPSKYNLACPECGHPYRLSDYRPEVVEIACSRCHGKLPRTS